MKDTDLVCVGCEEIVPKELQEIDGEIHLCNVCGDELCIDNGSEEVANFPVRDIIKRS